MVAIKQAVTTDSLGLLRLTVVIVYEWLLCYREKKITTLTAKKFEIKLAVTTNSLGFLLLTVAFDYKWPFFATGRRELLPSQLKRLRVTTLR